MPFNILSSLVKRIADGFSEYTRAFLMVLILAFALIISQAWSNGYISDFWNNIQPHSQKYTELAFLDPNNLPTSLAPNGSLSFGFMVHNVEDETTNYQYIISVQGKTGTETVSSGHFTLASNAKTSLKQTISIPTKIEPQEVIVSLPTQHESIDLLLNGTAS